MELEGTATEDLRVQNPRSVFSTIHGIFYQVIKLHNLTLHLDFKATLELKLYVQLAQWLRYCATNRKVAGSIPAGVIGIFH